jgi:hypothetical protein
MSNDLFDIDVTDRESFIRFLELFHRDFTRNKDSWENDNLERFLEAMNAYAKAIQFVYDNTGQNINADLPSWKVFADILKGASIYE